MKTLMMIATLFLLLLALVLVTGLGLAQEPSPPATEATVQGVLMGTAFTYQGSLQDASGPVDGICDFRFSLYADEGGTEQVGDTQEHTGVTLSQGLFTIPDLDFDAGAFTGEARWLAIAARCPAGAGTYADLGPLQALTPVPNALALPGLWTQQVADNVAPNLIGGYSLNSVGEGIWGATIGGGGEDWARNRVLDNLGTIAGGVDNQVGDGLGTIFDAELATIGGGASNRATGANATVAGGFQNTASITDATVSGGTGNLASGPAATIGGGGDNRASGVLATIGGGGDNVADGPYQATVAGGYDNRAGATESTVGGGHGNSALEWASTVAGGYQNMNSGGGAFIGGGESNTITSDGGAGVIGGGATNSVSAYAATVPGGERNVASGGLSFAAGYRAKAVHDGAFVWADSHDADFSSTANDQFNVRASGGVNFQTGGAPFLVNGAPVGGDSYENVVVVAQSGGDYTSVQAAFDAIDDASVDNPYLVWVAPGLYVESVTMKPYVHLQGAGQEATVISSTVGSSSLLPMQATLNLTDDVSLRDLTVVNSGGTASYYAALMAAEGTTRTLVSDVTARAQGSGDYNFAIFLLGGNTGQTTHVTLQHVTALAQNASPYNSGLRLVKGTGATLRGGSFTARGGTSAYGIHVQRSSGGASTTLQADGVTALAEGATNNTALALSWAEATLAGGSFTARGGNKAWGIYNSGNLQAQGVTALGENASINNYGLHNAADFGTYTVTLGSSQLTGASTPIFNDDEFTTLVGASLLDGGAIVTTTGTITCAGVYDENYAFYASTCP
jgi:hypothetical protein